MIITLPSKPKKHITKGAWPIPPNVPASPSKVVILFAANRVISMRAPRTPPDAVANTMQYSR